MFEAVRGKAKGRDDLFGRIGRFLDAQALEPSPANYTLAYAALADPDGPLAHAVARLTDGGVRLSRTDVAELGGSLGAVAAADDRAMRAEQAKAQALVAETEAQVDGFARMVRTIHAETQGFGRDLAATAGTRDARRPDEIARIAAAMLARVRDAEAQLAEATSEADTLRTKLAEARDSARKDALTGLANRRAFDEAFAARDRSGASGNGHWLAVCDVDHFKRLNDSHGHAVGDRVLRAIAQSLAETCPGQLVARYGGEEFAVLLAANDAAAAEALADRLRADVGARRFRTRDTDAPIGRVSISIGLTRVAEGETIAPAFERADRLLYLAKAEGRDRVCAG